MNFLRDVVDQIKLVYAVDDQQFETAENAVIYCILTSKADLSEKTNMILDYFEDKEDIDAEIANPLKI